MIPDRFDKLLALVAAAAAMALLVQLAAGFRERDAGRNTLAADRTAERELAQQAKLALIDKLYAPVSTLLDAGNPQAALLKLEEVNRRYPEEAHGHILKGEILFRLGALEEAAASFVRGVRLNGDYIDRNSPVSRRETIIRLVTAGARALAARRKVNPDSLALKASAANLNYLQSRLAGGCE